jgi:tetratricopeptide (TPR) repeat protein
VPEVADHLDPEWLATVWDFSDPAASETRFREAIAGQPPESNTALELRTQLARALGLQERFGEALAELDAIESTDDIVLARLNLEQGRVRNSHGQPADAVAFFELAREHASAASSDDLEVDALHMLAIVEPERAVEWTNRALAIAESSASPRTRRWRGALHNNLGWTFHDAADFAAALTHFERALEIYKESGTPDQVHIAWWSVARCYRSLGRHEEALAIQRRLAAEDPTDEYVAEEIAAIESSKPIQGHSS